MKPVTSHIKKIFTGLVFFLTGLVIFLLPGISPAAVDITDPDMFVFELINQYRTAPFAHAQALGYDAAFLQEKGIAPETVFAPYVLDEGLCTAATAANARAAAAAVDPVPVPPVRRRMIQTGSVFSFSHFMPIETAGSIFVQNLFKTELETGEFTFVLSDAFQYAGIGADPGVVAASQMNAWFFTLTLGSFERVSEMQILNLINQVRAEPALIDSYLDLPVLLQQNSRLYHLPNMDFAPVFIDDTLQQLAREDVGGLLSPESVDPDAAAPQVSVPTQDAVVPDDSQENYPGVFFETATVAASWEDMTAARPINDLFSALLHNEFSTWPYHAMVFSNRFTRSGVAVNLETVENTGTGIVSFFAGFPVLEPFQPEPLLPETPETFLSEETAVSQARIYGVLFTDHDDDYLYSPGEEEVQYVVTVFPLDDGIGDTGGLADITMDPVQTVVTDNAGHFSLELEPGRHWVFEAQKDDQVSRRIIYIGSDHFVKMNFTPPPVLP